MAEIDNGSIQVLITPLGGATPSGESAKAIREQLRIALSGDHGVVVNVLPKINVAEFTKAIQTQLAAGVKVNVTPNIAGATGTTARGRSSSSGTVGGMAKSDLTFLDKQLSTLETKAASFIQRLQQIKNVPLQSKGLQQYQAQYDRLIQDIYALAAGNRNLTESEKAGVRERVAELTKLVAKYEQVGVSQEKLRDSLTTYQMKAQAALGGLNTMVGPTAPQGQQAIATYQQLLQVLNQYRARGTSLSKAEAEWIGQQIALIKQLQGASSQFYSQQEASRKQSVRSAEQEAAALASMKSSLVNFQQYTQMLNPKALTQYAGEINTINTLLGSGVAANSKKAETAIRNFKAEMKRMGYEGGNAFATLFSKTKQYFSYFISSTIVMGLYSGVTKLVENVKTLDEAMTDLRIVTGDSREETEDLLKTYNKMAKTLGTTTTNVASGATDWLRQGYTGSEAEGLLTQSMTLSIVGDMESADATSALTSAIKGYQLAVEDASSVVDKFFTVDMAAATSSENLALALAKTAANAKLAGLSLDDVIAQLAVVNETLAESGEETGTFYNTMLSRIGALKAGRLSDPETDEDLSDVEATLRGLGIQLRDSESEFRNFGEVLNEVAGGWNNYTSVQQRAIATAFAGTRQQTRFIALMSNYAQAAEYSAIAADSAGKSAEKLAIYQESVEAKSNKATAAFEQFSTALLDSNWVGAFYDAGTYIFTALSALDAAPAKIALITAGVATIYSMVKSLGALSIGKNFLGFFSGLG